MTRRISMLEHMLGFALSHNKTAAPDIYNLPAHKPTFTQLRKQDKAKAQQRKRGKRGR